VGRKNVKRDVPERRVIASAEEFERRAGGTMNYKRVVFFLQNRDGTGPFDGPYRAKGRSDHRILIHAAIKSKKYLFYSSVFKRDGKFFAADQKIVDWDTVPAKRDGELAVPDLPNSAKKEVTGKKGKKESGGETYTCECGKVCTSKPGLTLHKKTCKKSKS